MTEPTGEVEEEPGGDVVGDVEVDADVDELWAAMASAEEGMMVSGVEETANRSFSLQFKHGFRLAKSHPK